MKTMIGVALAASLALATTAQATPLTLTIRVTDNLGTLTLTFSDGGTNQISLAPFSMLGVQISGEFASATIGATNILASSATAIVNTTTGPAFVEAVVSGQNFAGPATQVAVSGSGTWLNSPGSQMTQRWYDDPTNTLGGGPGFLTPGQLVASFVSPVSVGATSSFSTSPPLAPLANPDIGLFSMSQVWSYTLAPGGALVSRGQTELKFQDIPEPGAALLLGAGLLGLGLVKRRSA
jgi:hypothetical protein